MVLICLFHRLDFLPLNSDVWFTRNSGTLQTVLRAIFGVFWLVDGAFKFQPGFVDAFSGMISSAAAGQPSWLSGWFSFWASATSPNPALVVYCTGGLELAIGFCLVVGLLRKLAFTAAFFLSLVIWSVPEGFGGPYGPGSTDIGTGIVYALASVLFLVAMAAFGPSSPSLDSAIEKKWPSWKRLAEIKSD
jgi:nitrite reductase (NO-forming)